PGEGGHRPLVVTGPLRRVPWRGIAGAVIEQVELRVERVPAPGGPPASLPLVALPRLGALLALPEVRVGLVEIVGEQQLLVRSHAIRSPDLLAVPHVVGGYVPGDTEPATAQADV